MCRHSPFRLTSSQWPSRTWTDLPERPLVAGGALSAPKVTILALGADWTRYGAVGHSESGGCPTSSYDARASVRPVQSSATIVASVITRAPTTLIAVSSGIASSGGGTANTRFAEETRARMRPRAQRHGPGR